MTDTKNITHEFDKAAELVRSYAKIEFATPEKVMTKSLDDVKQAFTSFSDLPACHKLADILVSETLDFALDRLPYKFFDFIEDETPLRLEQFLMLSLAHEKPDMTYKLLQAGADIEADLAAQFNAESYGITTKGTTPLVHAIMQSNYQLISMLVNNKADPTKRPENAAQNPEWREALRKSPKNISPAIKQHLWRQSFFRTQIDPKDLHPNIQSHALTVDGENAIVDTLFASVLTGQFFNEISKYSSYEAGIIHLKKSLNQVSRHKVTIYDALFHRYDPAEIFDREHWLKQEWRMHVFFNTMPRYYQRKSRQAYLACTEQMNPPSLWEKPFRSTKKVRLKRRTP